MQDLEIKLLKYLTNHTEAVSSSRLAELCGVSKTTIQSRIPGLNSEIQQDGVFISGKTSSGYQLVITDESKASKFFNQLENQIKSPLFERNTDYNVNYLIRRLLSSNNYVPLDILCEELFYSKNSVKKDLESAAEWLKDFNLQIKLKKNYGYYIDGPEWYKRLALLSQDKLFVNLPENLREKEKNYIQMMGIDVRMQRNWYHIILDYMQNSSKLSASAIDFPIIAHYIELIPTRIRFQDQLSFSDNQLSALKDSGLTEEAEKILHRFEGLIQAGKAETEAFAMTLLVFRTITGPEQLTDREIQTLRSETDEILDFLKNNIPFFDSTDNAFTEKFMLQWYSIRNNILFDLSPDEEYFHSDKSSSVKFPVADLISEVLQYASHKFGKRIRPEQISLLFYLFSEWFDNKIVKDFQYRIAVISIYGYSRSCYFAERLEKQYSYCIKDVTSLEFTQMQDSLDSEYDILITDMRTDMLPRLKKCKIIEADMSENQEVRLPGLDTFLSDKTRLFPYIL